jgi:WD40 repeat protein
LVLVIATFSFAVSVGAQDVRKLVTLTTTSEVQNVSVCGETGLVAALGRDGSIHIWRLPSGETVTERPAQDGVRTLACSPDGKWLAVGKGDGSVVITDIRGTPIHTLAVAPERIVDLAFSPDASVLAVHVFGSPAQLWDPAKGVLIAAMQTDFAGCSDMAFSPDGALFAVADLDTTIRIYDRAGKLKAKYTGLLLEPFALSFMPDGKQLVVGGADCTLTLLDASDGHLVRALPKQADPVIRTAVLSSGAGLVSLHVDAASLKRVTALRWDLRNDTRRELPVNGSQIKGFGVTANHLPMLFTADSKTSLTAWTLPE